MKVSGAYLTVPICISKLSVNLPCMCLTESICISKISWNVSCTCLTVPTCIVKLSVKAVVIAFV